MVIKKMKLVAKPIHYENANQKRKMSQSGYGRQYVLFAKEIIDKYAKTLNYHFAYTALVFLEQMAGMEQRQQISKNVINITWKLLSFLYQEEDKRNLILYQNPWVMKQITRQIEDNLQQIKKEEKITYQDLKQCYKFYQWKIKNETITKKIEWEKIKEVRNYVEKKIPFTVLSAKEEKRTVTVITPFTMNPAFFLNLNHAVRENKIANYRQLWEKSVKQQLEQYYLNICMNAFVEERQPENKQELFLDIVQNYDRSAIEMFLKKADEKVYTQFLNYVQFITATIMGMDQIKEKKILEEKTQDSNKIKDKITTEIRKEQDGKSDREEHQKRLEEDTKEYKHIYNNIMEILEQTPEITKNIIREKSKEYKELFYKYIDSINSEVKIHKKEEKKDSQTVPYEKNQEIFSDHEIALLLKEQDRIEKKEKFPMELSIEERYLKEKLNLLAIKEVTERCLREDTKILSRENIEKIAKILGKVDFYSKKIEENKEFIQEIDNIENSIGIGIQTINVIFQEGPLLERKLLYLTMEEGISEILAEEKENDQGLQKQILALKSKVIQEEDYGKRMIGDWRFLMKKSRGREIIRALEELGQKERIYLKEKVAEKLQTFYQVQDILYQYYKQSQDSEKSLQSIYQEYGDLWEYWSVFFSREEMLQIYEKRIQQKNAHLQDMQKEGKELFWKEKMQIKDIVQILKNGKNTEKKLLLQVLNSMFSEEREICEKWFSYLKKKENQKILQINDIVQILKDGKNPEKKLLLQILNSMFSEEKETEKTKEKIDFLNTLQLTEKITERGRLEEYKKKKYNFVRNLRKNQENDWSHAYQHKVYFTENNFWFMEPPSVSVQQEKEELVSNILQYQKDNSHFVFNPAKRKGDYVNGNVPNKDRQERGIKELKGSILQYQMELEDKEKRIEIVEKKLKDQEENIQFLKSTQDNISKQVHSSVEAKKILNHLKEELQLEQMRNGRL